jgi:hypothetical protein
MLSRQSDQPLAQGFFSIEIHLADVSIWRKNRESTTLRFYRKGAIFSSCEEGLVDK